MSDKGAGLATEIENLLDDRFMKETQRYTDQLHILTEEFAKAGTDTEKARIAGRITRLTHAYDVLKEGYDELKSGYRYSIEGRLAPKIEYFEAKLNGKPHEWD